MLTTNYDLILESFERDNKKYRSIDSLEDFDSNFQRLFRIDGLQNIIHLHGSINDENSIVISKSKYNEVYEKEEYIRKLSALFGTKEIIFIGFSFADEYIQNLVRDNNNLFKNRSYILYPKNQVDLKNKERLLRDYRLKVIEYEVSNGNHVTGIRKVLNSICQKKSSVKNIENTDEWEWNEENLFYQKLKIENIPDSFKRIAGLFYASSEKFIRDLIIKGMTEDNINLILTQVFLKYKEDYYCIYENEKKSSSELLMRVHADLENIDFGRLFSSITKPADMEVPGLIHVLADDSSRKEEDQVWWGDRRI